MIVINTEYMGEQQVGDVKVPFISTDFCKAYHLVKHYKEVAVKDITFELAGGLRDIERNHFLKVVSEVISDVAVTGVHSYHRYDFDYSKEETFNKELFIQDMLECFDKHNGKLGRDFKIRLITNQLYTFGDMG